MSPPGFVWWADTLWEKDSPVMVNSCVLCVSHWSEYCTQSIFCPFSFWRLETLALWNANKNKLRLIGDRYLVEKRISEMRGENDKRESHRLFTDTNRFLTRRLSESRNTPREMGRYVSTDKAVKGSGRPVPSGRVETWQQQIGFYQSDAFWSNRKNKVESREWTDLSV